MAASATFALKAGVWFRRARLLIVSPDSRVNLARRQAETPLIPLFRFLRPALTTKPELARLYQRLFYPRNYRSVGNGGFVVCCLARAPNSWWGGLNNASCYVSIRPDSINVVQI